MEQRNVEAATKDIRIYSAMVQTPQGDKPAFIIEWYSINPKGVDLPVQAFLMTPQQVGFFSDRLREALQLKAPSQGEQPAAQ